MLTLFSKQTANRYCDGLSRRSFLRIGGLGLGGLSFPELLRAESELGVGKSQKALILVYLPGGPPHQDMYDIKVNAPSEVRGPFKATGTNVAGIQISEHLSRSFAVGQAPTLKRVIDLVRVLAAAELSKNTGYDVRDVAQVLGFASSSHLSSTTQRLVGARASSLTRLRTVDLLGRFEREDGAAGELPE